MRNVLQRRDAEKTKQSGGKAKMRSLTRRGTRPASFADLVFGFLCASLCVLCASALNPLLRIEQTSL
jgi:hypothetical protein